MDTHEHCSPALPGARVVFTARVEEMQGHTLVCSWEAHEQDRLLAKGKQIQKILSRERLKKMFDDLSGWKASGEKAKHEFLLRNRLKTLFDDLSGWMVLGEKAKHEFLLRERLKSFFENLSGWMDLGKKAKVENSNAQPPLNAYRIPAWKRG